MIYSNETSMAQRAAVGTAATLPPPVLGQSIEGPGEWAALVMKMNWKVARTGKALNTENLRTLSGITQKRELILRPGNPGEWSGTRLNKEIGESSRHVEAAATQIVGDYHKDIECEACEKEQGPFAHCVTFPGIPGCANCHWAGSGQSCTIFAGAKPRKHKKRRIDASSLDEEDEGIAGHILVELRDKISKAQAAQHRVYRQANLFSNLSPTDQVVLAELVRQNDRAEKQLEAVEEVVRRAQGFRD